MIQLNFKTLMACGVLLFSNSLKISAQNYTWIKGANTTDIPGTYGTISVPSSSANPGSRSRSATWKDASGNFWLFGGTGYDMTTAPGLLNDLWKYNPSTNQWTWIKGSSSSDQSGIYGTIAVPATANAPGSRFESTTWADASGNLWLFGGVGYDGSSNVGELNDLWKYNIATNQWTWVKGSNSTMQTANYGTMSVASASNIPGARYGSTGWSDASGNFWLFGGSGFNNTNNVGLLNDLWRYNPSTNQWAWMGGTNLLDVSGVYGTLSVPSSTNLPGGRTSAQSWIDATGNVWLFGGTGFDANSINNDFLNDLWKYNPATNQWTWVKGSNVILQTGMYGTLGVANSANTPGSREGCKIWLDGNSNVWLFGGYGIGALSPFPDNLNDLWRYNSATNQWTWMKGSNTVNQNGTYGTIGIQSSLNTPGSRSFMGGWLDANNNLWFFGGDGLDGTTNFGALNDLWKLNTCIAQSLTVTSTNTQLCSGQSSTLTVSGASTYTWNTLQSSTSITISPALTTTYIVNSTNSVGCTNNALFIQTVVPTPTITISGTSSLVCLGKSTTLTANGASTYSWNTNQTGTTIVLTPTVVAPLTLSCHATATNGCSNSAVYNVNVLPLPTLTVAIIRAKTCKGETNTLTVNGANSYSWHTVNSNTTAAIVISPTLTSNYTVTGTGSNGCQNMAQLTVTVSACAGINDNTITNLSCTIYPNPSHGEFTIHFTEELPTESLRLIVYNTMGQKVLEQSLDVLETKVESNLPEGVYYYQVNNSVTKLANGKLIIR
jgi:N-acetylneuraminic acid mutarotase